MDERSCSILTPDDVADRARCLQDIRSNPMENNRFSQTFRGMQQVRHHNWSADLVNNVVARKMSEHTKRFKLSLDPRVGCLCVHSLSLPHVVLEQAGRLFNEERDARYEDS